MGLLHIANTNFEWELTQQKTASLTQVMEGYLIPMQLQFLPLLYASAQDEICVSCLPVEDFQYSYPLHLLTTPTGSFGKCKKVESWGASLSVQAWARRHKLEYEMPEWEVVRKVNSKEFSFSQSKKLKNGALLYSEKEVAQWIDSVEGCKVLKSCFGTAGRGHLFVPTSKERVDSFLRREGFPVIGEPWVDRVIDFSTQWIIDKDGGIEFLGETMCLSNKRGQYLENRVGNILTPYQRYLDEHKEIAISILQKMATLGYFGNVGFDAMVYENDKLHPVVEINARKTMGYVALKMQQMHFPKQTIALSYTADGNSNLLPNSVVKTDGSRVAFVKKLMISVLDK